MGGFKCQSLLLVLTMGTYEELYYIETFSVNKCQHFKWVGLSLRRMLILYNTLKVFPVGEADLFFAKKTGFLSNSSHKTAAEIMRN